MVYAAYFIVGFWLGVCVIGFFLWKSHLKLIDEINALQGADDRYNLLAARVRGIQHSGKPVGKAEVQYNVQQPNGKFGKFTLPLV